MKICFISPYIGKHFGGGEKYLLDCARVTASFTDEVYQVCVAVPQVSLQKDLQKLKKSYQDFLDQDLHSVSFIKTPLFSTANFLSKLLWTKQFDCLYYETDGSLFFSWAKKNILHIQVPFTDSKKSLLSKIKLKNWTIKNTNSYFTKKVIQQSWRTHIKYVHSPLVELQPIKPNAKKEKIILNVGRFFSQLHSKKQDVLVDFFKTLIVKYQKKMKGWKLVLIGSVEDQQYAQQVKKAAAGLPIEFYHSVTRDKLIQWYRKAEIYWHATGYQIDQDQYPEKMEHFGITTVEAMSQGCIPVVINKGGQPEILGDQLSELLWDTKTECLDKTVSIIDHVHHDSKVDMRAKVIDRSQFFNQEPFIRLLKEMIF